MRKLLTLVMLLGGFATAQGNGMRFENFAWTTTVVGSSATSVFKPVPGASVTVCGVPAVVVAGVCTNTVPIYSNEALTTLVSPSGAVGNIIADAYGNYGFWLAAGTYSYTVTGTGITATGPYSFTLGLKSTNSIAFNTVALAIAAANGVPGSQLWFPANSTVDILTTVGISANVRVVCESRYTSILRMTGAVKMFTGSGTVRQFDIQNCNLDGNGVGTGVVSVPDFDSGVVDWADHARFVIEKNYVHDFTSVAFSFGRSVFFVTLQENEFYNNGGSFFADRYVEYKLDHNFFHSPRTGTVLAQVKVTGSANDIITNNVFQGSATVTASELLVATPSDGDEAGIPLLQGNNFGPENDNASKFKLQFSGSVARVSYSTKVTNNIFSCGVAGQTAINITSPVGHTIFTGNTFNACSTIINDAQNLFTDVSNNLNVFDRTNVIIQRPGYPVTLFTNGGRGFKDTFNPNGSLTDNEAWEPRSWEAVELRNQIAWSENAVGHWTLNNYTVSGGACNQTDPLGGSTACLVSHATASSDNIQIPVDNTGLATTLVIGMWLKCGTSCDQMISLTDVSDSGKLHGNRYVKLTTDWKLYKFHFDGLTAGHTYRVYYALDFGSTLTVSGTGYIWGVHAMYSDGPYVSTAGAAVNTSTAGYKFNNGVEFGKTITRYNGIATVSNGVPSLVGQINLTGQNAAISPMVSVYTAPSNGAGIYNLCYYIRITTAAGTSSSVTPTFKWTDGGVAMSLAGAAITGNTTATYQTSCFDVHADASTAITYETAYASNAANAAIYSFYIRVAAK